MILLFLLLAPLLVLGAQTSPARDLLVQGAAMVQANNLHEGQAILSRARALLTTASADERASILPSVLYNLGIAHQRLGDGLVALQLFEETIDLDPSFAVAWNGRGAEQMRRGLGQASIESFRRAIALNDQDASFHNNLGLALFHVRDLQGSTESYRRALELDDGNMRYWNDLGVAYLTGHAFGAAIPIFKQALALSPPEYRGRILFNMLLARNRIGSWDRYYALNDELRDVAQARPLESGLSPFNCLEFPALSEQFCGNVTRIFTEKIRRGTSFQSRFWRNEATQRRDVRKAFKGKLRIGYLHAMGFIEETTTARLVQSLFSFHDHTRFDVACYALRGDDGSETRQAIKSRCPIWREMVEDDNTAVAQQIWDDGIHVLIDLTGYTLNTRAEILDLRPAPVQVAFHGFPGSMQAPEFIDWQIADRHVAPPELEKLYGEKLAYMPDTYFATSYREKYGDAASREPDSRSAVGLPASGFLFCSFNQQYKVTPRLFDVWMRILTRVPGSSLWMLAFAADAEDNFRREARARGVDPARIVFTPLIDRSVEYETKSLCNIALDTPMFNGHSTGTDTLWAGVPIITHPGNTNFAARVGISLLHAHGFPELVARSLREYEELAVGISSDEKRYATLRRKVERARWSSPLFDTRLFTANFEALLQRMWEIHRARKTAHVA